jgi:hypothetical protein
MRMDRRWIEGMKVKPHMLLKLYHCMQVNTLNIKNINFKYLKTKLF